MYALFVKEVNAFFNSLIGYITISVFLLGVGLFMWIFSGMDNVFEMRLANLDSLFLNAPIWFILLIPAITMRSLAEEKKTGTIELLFTKPVTDLQIVLAKFFAAYFIVVLSLIPTLVYFITIYMIGNPPGNIDSGATWGGYFGLFFIGAMFTAIGIFSSALFKNQVLSFIFAAALCLIFYVALDYGTYQTLGGWQDTIKNIGIKPHFNNLKRGILDTRDVTYFITMTVGFLVLTRLSLQKRNW